MPVLLLDLDGTLVDSNAAHSQGFVEAAAALGVPIPRDRIDREIGKGADLLVADVFGESFDREHGDALRERGGERFREIARAGSLAVFEGAEALVAAAQQRGLKTALATSSAEADLDALFASAGVDFREHVDLVLSASAVDRSKPAPDLVSEIADRMGVPTSACVLVGDTVYDGRAARRAGAAFVGVATWTWSEAELQAEGARATYPSTAALAADLDRALAAALSGAAALSAETADALMAEALGEAGAALDAGDLPIGAVVATTEGEVLARGRNRAGTGDRLRHAETEALHALMDADRRADGLVLVTSLEPCAMCLGAAVEAGIHAVLYPLEAPPNGAAHRLDPLPGRRLPLVSRWAGAGHRDASLALLRRAADRDGGFAARLVDAIDADA